MLRIKTLSIKMSLLLILVAVLGCPVLGKPVLSVSPGVFSFDINNLQATLALSNTGGRTLTWQLENLPSWLSASPLSGSITNADQVVALTANSAGLPAGTYPVEITVASNAGDRGIMVTMTVVAPPILEVTPLALDFGTASTGETFTIHNTGSTTLTWSIPSPLPASFSVDVSSGETSANGTQQIIVSFDRANATLGSHAGSITIASNGGAASVTVAASVQALSVTPLLLDFGSQFNQLPFTLTNLGTDPINWTINVAGLPAWATLVANQPSGTLAIGANLALSIAVDRTGLNAGESLGNFTIMSDSGNATVRLRLEELPPILSVLPLSLDFGNATTTNTLSIANKGSGILSWSIQEGQVVQGVWTPQDVPWLAVGNASGQVAANQTMPVTVTVDRSQVTPNANTPFVGALLISSPDGQQQVVSVSQMSIPPTLRVLPRTLNYGTTYTNKQLAIWNGGLGTVNWTINTAGMPAWMSIPSGIVTGAVTGDETDSVKIMVDRTGLPPQEDPYQWSFDVTAVDQTGFTLEPTTITVTISVPKYPIIVLDTGNVDTNGIAFIPFGAISNKNTFTIQNTGTAPLDWTIDLSTKPDWLISVEPSQYVLPVGETIVVTATVDRKGLAAGDQMASFIIESNDPFHGNLPIRFELLVPKTVSIGVRRDKLIFGLTGITDYFEVANYGDPGTILNFQVSSNKPWLFVSPETGQSIGTSSILKDFQTVNVSVDRSRLDSPTGGSGTITVSAFEIDADGHQVPIPTAVIEWKYIQASVEAAPLSFEGTAGRVRVPSLVRFVELMRDLAYRAIPLSEPTLLLPDLPDLYKEFTDNFAIFEQQIILEPAEANQFLTSGAHLRTNVAILLDYSNSMYASAQAVSDPTIANAADPLQALYERCVGALIDDLPGTYSVALMEFHERNQSTIEVRPVGEPLFISDKAALHARLESINITDHGASDLLTAILNVGDYMANKDAQFLLSPFDDADFRAFICFTDGRYTTAPSGQVDTAQKYLADLRVRFFPVGWGINVLPEPLARIAAGTGGHFYSMAPDNNNLPSVDNLLGWCTTDDPAINPCDQAIGKDLRSQIVLSYVTLAEYAPVTVRVDATLDNPNDGLCNPLLGTISGSFTQTNFNMASVTGDVRLGQISLRTDGILSGNARVVVRADYIPRNVDSFEFQITSSEAFTISTVPDVDGGLIAGWTVTPLGGGVFSITRPAPLDLLKYGAFGDMLYLDFAAPLPPSFFVHFAVTDPVYNALDPNGKYYTCPDRITVANENYFASALPQPQFRVVSPLPVTDPTWMHLDTANPVGTIEIRNLGGSHIPTGVWLTWELGEPAFIMASNPPQAGVISSNSTVQTITVTLDPAAVPGVYADMLSFLVGSGSLYYYPLDIYADIPITATVP